MTNKKILAVLSFFILFLNGCGSSNSIFNTDANLNTPDQVAVNIIGTWSASCTTTIEEDAYKETLIFAPGGAGSYQKITYGDERCTEGRELDEYSGTFVYTIGELSHFSDSDLDAVKIDFAGDLNYYGVIHFMGGETGAFMLSGDFFRDGRTPELRTYENHNFFFFKQ